MTTTKPISAQDPKDDMARAHPPTVCGNRGTPFRPIQYLGSKMRLLDGIQEAVASVSGPDGSVCDLFSGSGVVSHHLSFHWPVIAVDVQQYARVLAGALLQPPESDTLRNTLLLVDGARTRREPLLECFAPLIELESACLQRAREGNPESLADFIDFASVPSIREDSSGVPNDVGRAATEVMRRLACAPAAVRKFSMMTELLGVGSMS